jgi:Transposase DDE domain
MTAIFLSYAVITDGKVSDVKVAYLLEFDPGTIVVDDRGYNDYELFEKWTGLGIFFVTRMKDNAVYEVVERRKVPENGNILKDEVIRLTGLKADEKCPSLLRRIEM